jgi:predicted nucleotidyltransferase
MKLNSDFKEFIKLLNFHSVKYLLIGGWSVALHGRPRYTKDIDFFLLASDDNSEKMKKVIDEFGFSSMGISEADFKCAGQIIQLGIEPHRIDLINEIKGVAFKEAWERRTPIEIAGLIVNVISLDDLIQNKLATARPQDLADAELLKKLKGSHEPR